MISNRRSSSCSDRAAPPASSSRSATEANSDTACYTPQTGDFEITVPHDRRQKIVFEEFAVNDGLAECEKE